MLRKRHPDKQFLVRAQWDSSAPPSAIFALVKDSSTYPEWSPVGGYRMERPGFSEPHGVGEIRVLITGPLAPREEIVEIVPDRYVSYRLLSGLPIKNYLGETELEPLPAGGTRIVWQSSFDEAIPFTGWFWVLVMRKVLGIFVRTVSTAAELATARAGCLPASPPLTTVP